MGTSLRTSHAQSSVLGKAKSIQQRLLDCNAFGWARARARSRTCFLAKYNKSTKLIVFAKFDLSAMNI